MENAWQMIIGVSVIKLFKKQDLELKEKNLLQLVISFLKLFLLLVFLLRLLP